MGSRSGGAAVLKKNLLRSVKEIVCQKCQCLTRLNLILRPLPNWIYYDVDDNGSSHQVFSQKKKKRAAAFFSPEKKIDAVLWKLNFIQARKKNTLWLWRDKHRFSTMICIINILLNEEKNFCMLQDPYLYITSLGRSRTTRTD